MTINTLSVVWGGLMEAVVNTIDKWEPGKLSRELAYRDSLLMFLRKSAPAARVEKEYRHQGTTVDLAVMWEGVLSDDRVLIELKLNLTKKSQLDRLVGQIEAIQPLNNPLMLILCGETNPIFLDRLRYKYSDYLDPMLCVGDLPMVIRLKAHAKASK